MSRIGKAPVVIPSGVDVAVKGTTVEVKGPKGSMERTFSDRIAIVVEEGEVRVARSTDEPRDRAQHGLVRALIANMVAGVSEGYVKHLSLEGVGYRAAMKGASLELQVGFSHPVLMDPPDGITIEVPEADQDQHFRNRQRTGWTSRGRHPQRPTAGALQGQRNPLRR